MSDNVDVPTIMAHKFEDLTTVYTQRDVALYALTVGAAEDPLDEADLPLVYELSEDFKALPTFAVTFPFAGLANLTSMPGLSFNPMMLLHGEQEVQLFGELPTSGTITTKLRVGGCYDKGKGALLYLDSDSFDESNRKVCSQRSSVFIRGIGGFGGDRGPKAEPWAVPNRKPDATATYKTAGNLALAYRLNGDQNPLHADPAMAAMGGFDKPILHGLCSFGVAGRAILKEFCDNDVTKFSTIKGRFAKHVFPGETLVTSMWREGNRVLYVTKVLERDAVVITNGVVTLASSGEAAAEESKSSSSPVDALFEEIESTLKRDSSIAAKVKGNFQFKLGSGTWNVDLKDGGAVYKGDSRSKPDLTITVSDEDFVQLSQGKLNPQQAFMRGKIKIKGNMGLAMKLGPVLQAARPASKL